MSKPQIKYFHNIGDKVLYQFNEAYVKDRKYNSIKRIKSYELMDVSGKHIPNADGKKWVKEYNLMKHFPEFNH